MRRQDITVFSKDWFKYHQRKLVWFANTRFGRYTLRIHGKRSSVGKHRITRIEPHAIQWKDGDKVVWEFRTHAKFSKRLYHAFKPFWYVLHAWDIGIANNLDYALNVGFDTLTVHPDADPETTTVDGHTGRSSVDETFSTIQAAAATFANDSSDNILVRLSASSTTDQFDVLQRMIFLFDTSPVDDDFALDSATLSLFGVAVVADFGVGTLHICSSNPASDTSLVTADHTTLGSTSFGNVSTSSYATGSYNDISLNASGIAAVTKTGISKFGARSGYDISASFTGSWMSAGDLTFNADSADEPGTTQDPKLVVESHATTTSSSSSTSSTSTSTTTSFSTSSSTSTSSTSSSTSQSTSTSFSTSTSTSTSSTTTIIDNRTIPKLTIQPEAPRQTIRFESRAVSSIRRRFTR